MAWQKNGTPQTATSTGSTLTISDLTKKQFNQILIHGLDGTGAGIDVRLGDGSVDSGNNYAFRRSFNGAADATTVSTSLIQATSVGDSDQFTIGYICAISGEEALAITFLCMRRTAGAANAPSRQENVGKWITTTQFDNVQYVASTGFAIDSNISALGTD